MKNFLLAFVATMLLTLSGCAFLDGLMLEQAKTADGTPLFIDKDDKITTSPVDPETGEENIPAYLDETSDTYDQLTTVATGASGPFAPLVTALLGVVGTVYMSLRGRRKVKANKIISDLMTKLSGVALRIYADARNGVVDANGDGTISLEEAKKYALESGVPVGAVVDMLEIVKKNSTQTETQAALEKLVAEYGK